jgi:dUTP pyrophosphatase
VNATRVLVQRLSHYPTEWALPSYATAGSAAVDLRNALPAGTEAQIRPRSGLALHRGISIINTPCTIDSDYRGEIRIPLINLDAGPQRIEHGERIAQMLIATVQRIEWESADTLPESERGAGGFGSTGR